MTIRCTLLHNEALTSVHFSLSRPPPTHTRSVELPEKSMRLHLTGFMKFGGGLSYRLTAAPPTPHHSMDPHQAGIHFLELLPAAASSITNTPSFLRHQIDKLLGAPLPTRKGRGSLL